MLKFNEFCELRESWVKVGDIIKTDVPEGEVLHGKTGKVISIANGMAQIDFGNGDKYGVTFDRIKDGVIIK